MVGKGYKFILKQLDDFCGVVNQIVISLKSVEGRKKYEEVFQRKIVSTPKGMVLTKPPKFYNISIPQVMAS